MNPLDSTQIPLNSTKNTQFSTQIPLSLTYCCNWCNRNFSRKDSLLRHQRNNCKKKSQTEDILQQSVVTATPCFIQTQVIPQQVISPPVPVPVPVPVHNYYECEYCEKIIKHRPNLKRHEAICKEKGNTAGVAMGELVELLNQQLQQQNAQINEQNKQIQELIKKAGINNNNIINNINNNNITLAYDKTSTTHLTDADYMRCINKYNRCIPNLVKQIHFNSDATENHNIYISGIKNNFVMLYDGEKWKLSDRNDAIMKLINDKEGLIEQKLYEWEESGHKNYPVAMEKFNLYLDQRETDFVMNRNKRDIKLMLFNHRDIVDSTVAEVNNGVEVNNRVEVISDIDI